MEGPPVLELNRRQHPHDTRLHFRSFHIALNSSCLRTDTLSTCTSTGAHCRGERKHRRQPHLANHRPPDLVRQPLPQLASPLASTVLAALLTGCTRRCTWEASSPQGNPFILACYRYSSNALFPAQPSVRSTSSTSNIHDPSPNTI